MEVVQVGRDIENEDGVRVAELFGFTEFDKVI